MPNLNRKRAGAKLSIILLSTFIFLLLFASPAAAVTLGDVTEKDAINVQDVVLVMQHILGIADPELTEDQLLAADVNDDDAVNVQDATLIMQYVLGLIDEFPAPDPVDVEVVSVKAINRTTIEVELEEDVDEDFAADEDEYDVTVDGDAVEVEEVDYDADDDLAVLTVDMDGMFGVLKVNGVEAEDEVPPIPEFISVSAVEGSRDFVLKFNTPVYEKNTLRKAIDFEVSVAGTTQSIDEIEVAEDVDDAVDELTITVAVAGRPDAYDSVVVTIKSSGADRIANAWGETMDALEVRSTTAQKDDTPPTFEGITAYNDSTFVVAHFSEKVNTSNYDIEVGTLAAEVRVTGEKPDGTPLSFAGDGIVKVDIDEEETNLRIELNDKIPAGAELTVSFGTTAGSRIKDRAGNSLAGTYTRSAVALAGPTLKDAEASDLGADADDQVQTFKVTLEGTMDSDEELTIDLTDPDAEGIDYHSLNNRYSVSGASGSVTISGNIITFAPSADVADGTAITITARDVDTSGVNAQEDIEVIYQRSEVDATATAKFDVISGLKDLSIETEYERRDDAATATSTTPVYVLASGQTGHVVTFEFTLTDVLEDGDSVEINVGNLVDAGAAFSSDDLSVSVVGDADVSMSGNRIIVTADGNISADTEVTVTAQEVDVALGSAVEDVEVFFTRADSGLSFVYVVDIVPGFVDFEVTNIDSATDQTAYITFELDGERDGGGLLARVRMADSNIDYTDAEAYIVYGGGSVSITDAGTVTYTAPLGGLSDGTEVAIEITGIDADTATGDALIVLERRPGGFETATVMDVE